MRNDWRRGWLAILLLVTIASAQRASASRASLERINKQLAGRLVDHTHNHGEDNRIWSTALRARRDLYVYLPPGYDCSQQYPVVLWLHGVIEDERTIIREGSLAEWDAAMACGRLPPMIIAIPDGSMRGRPTLLRANPLWLNSQVGRFEDYVVDDVWPFVLTHYPIRPERQAHVIGGFSGGGMGAYRLAIKYRPEFGVVFGIHPPVNVRWLDCHGVYFSDFDPCCWGWRNDVSWGREPLARFYGIIVIRMRNLIYPLFGKGPETVAQMSRENPIEMIDYYDVRPGELAMYVAYGGRDQFNITAQADSFLYRARERGLEVSAGFEPRGKHNWATALKLQPCLFRWLNAQLNAQLGGYSPDRATPCVFIKH